MLKSLFTLEVIRRYRPISITILILMMANCGQSHATYHDITLPYPQQQQNRDAAPTAWLIHDTQATLATVAAVGSSRGHSDPAPIIPDIAQATLPLSQPIIIIVDTQLPVQVEATLRPWSTNNTITPLIDNTAHKLTVRSHQEGAHTVLVIDPIQLTGDQLLNVHLTSSTTDIWSFYLWKLTPATPTSSASANINVGEQL